METPNIFKGHQYPTARTPRCPMFHACTVSKKCQNYDKHRLICTVCESRTNAHEVDPNSVPLGGHLPEGEYYPDLQAAMMELEKLIHKPLAHPDAKPQSIQGAAITRDYEREHKVTEMIRHFSSVGALHMEEKIMHAMVDPDIAQLLGRLE